MLKTIVLAIGLLVTSLSQASASSDCPSNLNGSYLWLGEPEVYFQQSFQVTINQRNECSEFSIQIVVNEMLNIKFTLKPGLIDTVEEMYQGQLIGYMHSTVAFGPNEIVETRIRTFFEANGANKSFTSVTRYWLNDKEQLVFEETTYKPRAPSKVIRDVKVLDRIN
ncbi:MAG: hypothetical protein ACLGGX_12125 [Bdellovibrionia bacterium]